MAAPSAPARPSSRIAGIEGLRACAAGAIVLLHATTILGDAHLTAYPGWLNILSLPLTDGVTLFFVLSGFLLWRPIAGAIAEGRSLPSRRRYARNRLLRIVPAYWAVLVVSALVLGCVRLVPRSDPPLAGALHDPWLLAKDALLVQGLSPRTLSSGIEPAWSLAVEVTFYLLLPVLGLFAAWFATRAVARRHRTSGALLPVALLALVAVAGKLVATLLVPGPEGEFHSTWHSVIDRSFLTHADLFAAGMLVAVLRIEHAHGRLRVSPRVRAYGNCLLVASPLLAFAFYLGLPHYLSDPLTALLFAVLLTRVLASPQGEGQTRLVRMLELRPFAAAGVISYSAFLWSGPATIFVAQHGIGLRGQQLWQLPIDLAIMVAVVAVLATVTYLAIECPALRARDRGVERRHVGLGAHHLVGLVAHPFRQPVRDPR